MTLDEHIAEMLAAGGTDALVGFIIGMGPRRIAIWRRSRDVPNLRRRKAVDRAAETRAISASGRHATGLRAGAITGPQVRCRPARLARHGRLEEGLGDFG